MARKVEEPVSSGAVNQWAFDQVMSENLSPGGIAAIIALLQPAGGYRNGTPENEKAINEVNWFRETLVELIGVKECNRLMNEVGM